MISLPPGWFYHHPGLFHLAGLPYSAAVYIAALTIDCFTFAFACVIALDVIMQQPMEVPERPAPQ